VSSREGQVDARRRALCRAANESILAAAETFAHAADYGTWDFVCECGRDGCRDIVAMSLGEYETVRADGRRFLVVPKHVDPTARIVAKAKSYAIVELTGEAADLAQASNPRAGDEKITPDR
jgi:hypothetical protein